MTRLDGLYKQLEDLRKDMKGLSTQTSTYRKLQAQSIALGVEIEKEKKLKGSSLMNSPIKRKI